MRTEVTYLERWPYSVNSLLPWTIGYWFSGPGVTGWCSCAWAWRAAMSPSVNPPANAAPLLRSSLRLVLFEFISLSLERNDTTKLCVRRREHMPHCQIWPVLMSRGLRILKRQLVRRLPAAWRVGADHPQAQPSSVRNRGYAIRAGVSECVSRSYSPRS